MKDKKKIDLKDWNDSRDVVRELLDNFGAEKSVAMLLMSLGNTFKHLAHNVSEDKFKSIMSDPVINLSAKYSSRLMAVGDVLLKKYGFREK